MFAMWACCKVSGEYDKKNDDNKGGNDLSALTMELLVQLQAKKRTLKDIMKSVTGVNIGV